MQKTIHDLLWETGQNKLFRTEFLASGICTQITLKDILDAPETQFEALSTQRGMGAVSLARLRQFIAREFSAEFPDEWRDARHALSSGEAPQNACAQALARFITSWKVDADTITLTGRYFSLSDLNVGEIAHKLGQDGSYVYVPTTLPYTLKTRKVVACEARREHYGKGVTEKLGKTDVHRKHPGTFLIDTFILQNLLEGTGRYHDLPDLDRAKQLQILWRVAQKKTRHNYYAVDTSKNGLSPTYLSGESQAMVIIFGGILEITAPDMVRMIRDRVQAAKETGQTLGDWFAARAAHPLLLSANNSESQPSQTRPDSIRRSTPG